ncbi:MAG: helix-turn-helix domain-containing protein [Actinomycetota bacterium]|nr:helix-turn-helix domain-containing protein [Actinomycetota bacterium]
MPPTASRIAPGTAIRLARLEAGWSQTELGRRCGYSASQVSRWETGAVPLRDIKVLRTVAAELGLPPEMFGLSSGESTGAPTRMREGHGPMVGLGLVSAREEVDDPVRRRAFLTAAGMAGANLVWSPATGTTRFSAAGFVDPARLLADLLAEVLLSPATNRTDPARVPALGQELALARREFAACQYVPLATRLPTLITAAEATLAARPERAEHQILAQVYNLATRALIKLEASGLEWLSADRGLHTARAADDPLTLAESQRLVASVARRAGHHDRAQALALTAAGHLDVQTARPDPRHLQMYGTLLCSAGYAAARAGNRDRANDLLTEADTTVRRLTDAPESQKALAANVVSHRVSAAYLLGDTGTALAHAHSLPLAAVPTTERRARLLVDTAMAYAQWDKPDRAYRTLLAAERTAPGEVHTRNAVRRLVTDLMASSRQPAMPGLPDLATRVHATT